MSIAFEGEFSVPVTQEEAYAFLSDPEKFCPCLPTYRDIAMDDAKTAQVKVAVGVGKIRGTAAITLTIEEEEPPRRTVYLGKGKVLGGTFSMTSAFVLEPVADGTLVKWEGDLQLFGKLVGLAGGLIRPLAEKDIQRLINALQSAMVAPQSA